MTKTKKITRWLLSFLLLSTVISGLVGSQLASAAEEEKIALFSPYPVLQDVSGNLFEFTVILQYTGTQAKVFDLTTEVPSGGYALIMSALESKGIASVRLDPEQGGSNAVNIRFNPKLAKPPEPGEYKLKFTARSGNLSASIDLKAIVTAKYSLLVSPGTGRFNADITAGQENHITIVINNKSTVAVDEVALYAAKPDGWSATWVPGDRIDTISPDGVKVVDVVITPPKNTIAGDYEVSVRAESKNAWDEQKLRVTVMTPTIWGWVGILMVVGVIGGLAVVFRQLGRR